MIGLYTVYYINQNDPIIEIIIIALLIVILLLQLILHF